jgi:uroporphyrinogen-III synthase
MNRFKILSTKILKPSLLEQVKESNVVITEQDFISIKPVLSEELHKHVIDLAATGIQTIALTSKNAVEVLDMYMHVGDIYYAVDWKIFCLSGATKQAVSDAPFLEKNIIGEAENAADLAKEIIRQDAKEIIFFCGSKRRDDLPGILKKAGIVVHEVVLYETLETPEIVTKDFDGVMFFSPSAVQSFFSTNQLSVHTVCFAIGNTTAEAIASFTNNKIIISESPGQEMLLSSVQFYFQNINCYE